MNLYLLAGNVIMALVFLLKLGSMPPQLPLFYSMVWGEEQLVDTWMILILPLLMNGLVFLNNFIVQRYFYDNDFIKQFTRYFNIFLIVCFSLIFVRIILLVS